MSEKDEIIELFNAYKLAVKTEIDSCLELSDKLSDLIDNSKNNKYQLNLLDIFKVDEPLTSKIIEQIFKYEEKGEYILYHSFIINFLQECGFRREWIKEPFITAEKDRIDVRIEEKGKYAIIIENKVKGACFQRNQIARYIQIMKNSEYSDDKIFIIILSDKEMIDAESYFKIQNKSIWCLPSDWLESNNKRKCRYKDDISCRCDYGKQCPNDISCEDFRETFKPRTIVLGEKFIEWLEECITLISIDECLLRSAIIQFVDFLKGKFEKRLDNILIKEMEHILREQFKLNEKQSLIEQLEAIDKEKKSVERLSESIKKLKNDIAEEQMELWKTKLEIKWGDNVKYFRRNKGNIFFGININGFLFGCAYEENFPKPFWGIEIKGKMSKNDEMMISKILDEASLPMRNEIESWWRWNFTNNGLVDCDILYNAAVACGYLEKPKQDE